MKEKGKKILKGTIRVTAKPIGFVRIEDENSTKKIISREEDIIVFEEELNCALNRDEVEIEIIGKDKDRAKGKVIKILKRNKTRFVGVLEKKGQSMVFMPDDFKFYRQVEIKTLPEGAEEGLKALVEIEWTNPNLNPQGKVINIIGKKGEHETEMQSILMDKGIVYNFPEDVEKEAEKVAKEFDGLLRETFASQERRDIRNILTCTIDPADAKDYDDALSYEEIGDGKIRVGVHIADVSYFVTPGSALDREARERSFSTYLVDRTIPMLPEVLSNNLCSLMEGVDRFAFSAVFDIKKETGKILDRWFGRTVINSNKRFSYEEAQAILDRTKVSEEFSTPLFELNRIANIYRKENKKNGAIEFETEEVKFQLDAEGKPIKIYKKARLDTMKMIEEWMLLANREVAKFISSNVEKRGGASIFRVHGLPNMEKIEELAIFVRALGHELSIKSGQVTAKDINALLSQIEGHTSESLIKTAAIRSMAKAVYSTKNIGHFGLAFEYYTHFTSPIRRYPDLLVHRILDRYLNNRPLPKDELSKFEKISKEASEKEVVIQEAERESIKYKQVEYMVDKVGEEFDCTISGVTEWGMYVEDPETKAEGMVRLRDMGDDFYQLDAKNYAIVGERNKKKFSLGDKVKVKLLAADLDRKSLDFKLV